MRESDSQFVTCSNCRYSLSNLIEMRVVSEIYVRFRGLRRLSEIYSSMFDPRLDLAH